MPKVKSKSTSDTSNEDGSVMTTRSNSIDADADQSNGVTDDISQASNNTSANMPISHPSSLYIFFFYSSIRTYELYISFLPSF